MHLNAFYNLIKKTRHLKSLGFRIPLGVISKSHQASQIYPYAISLLESINVYNKICNYVCEKNYFC